MTIFGTRAASVWKVWCRSIAPDLCGGARRFYVALDRGNRRLLIEHIACAVREQDEECPAKETRMLTINGATRVRSMYGFARSKSSEITSMPGGWQWTSRKWNGLRDCLRRIIRRMTGDKRSSMPATPGGKLLITNESGRSGWRTTRVGRSGKMKTRAKCN